MDLLLTAFGLSHLGQRDGPFYKLPPVTLSVTSRSLLPDFSVLLLCDKLIVDKESFERLMRVDEWKNWAFADAYLHASRVLGRLHDEGFVRLEDFDVVVAAHRPFLESLLAEDLSSIERWAIPLQASIDAWRTTAATMLRAERVDANFAELLKSDPDLRHRYGDVVSSVMHGQCDLPDIEYFLETRQKGRRRKLRRDRLSPIAKEYLAYVNCNLVLSQHFRCGFHDWSDIRPFYETKFRGVGRKEPPGQAAQDSLAQLFQVAFPDLAVWSTDALLRALRDPRIAELRTLISEAADGKLTIDENFAKRVLLDVFRIEKGVAKLRHIVSYLTVPLHLVPVAGFALEKLTEEAVMHPIERRRREKYRWFYLISELAEQRG